MFRAASLFTTLAPRRVVPSLRRRASFATMSAPPPNTRPPKGITIINELSKVASGSDKFRRVLWTGEHSQLVIMTIPVGGEIGEETHTVDQHLYFVAGTAEVHSDGKKTGEVKAGDTAIVPAGTLHNFINTSSEPLIVTTVYAPAEHKATTVHDSLEQGEKLEEEGKDEPPSWAKD